MLSPTRRFSRIGVVLTRTAWASINSAKTWHRFLTDNGLIQDKGFYFWSANVELTAGGLVAPMLAGSEFGVWMCLDGIFQR